MTITDEELTNRFTYHPPKPEDPEVYGTIRQTALDFANRLVTVTPASREQSLAITALEEAVMWANAARARHGAPATS